MMYSIDVEADGPCPGLYSMISLGAVCIETGEEFYVEFQPISNQHIPEALKVSGFTREDCMKFPPAAEGMIAFEKWIKANDKGRPIFLSDNAGFDWQFVNYYFHRFTGGNPFGFSPVSLTWFSKGLHRNLRSSFHKYRTSAHTHNALDDARGNAGAWLELQRIYKF